MFSKIYCVNIEYSSYIYSSFWGGDERVVFLMRATDRRQRCGVIKVLVNTHAWSVVRSTVQGVPVTCCMTHIGTPTLYS